VLDQFIERSDQSTDQQNEAEGEDEAEYSKLGVITWSRRVPSVEELNQRQEKRSQTEKQNPELEETPHSLSIERAAKDSFSMARRGATSSSSSHFSPRAVLRRLVGEGDTLARLS
jgi:hypothetical protein